ncbi:MAG: MATE family efflux transporter [Pseudomonadota bacterium]
MTTDIRATWRLAAPLIGGHLAQQLIGMTDTLMLGRYGVLELAAGGLGAMVYFVIFIGGSGLGLAVLPLVAAAAVAGNVTQARRITRMGMWLSVCVAALAMPVFWFSGPLLLALGQEPEIAAGAQSYLRIAGTAMVFSLLGFTLKNHLAALEHVQVALWSTLAAAGLNAVMNYLLIFGHFGLPELGLRGAAIATLGTQALICVILALYAARAHGLSEYRLFQRLWRPDWSAMGQVLRLGAPIGGTQLAETGLFAASTLMMGWISTLHLAAHGVALQIASVTFMAHVGLSSAATVRAGQAWTRADAQGLGRAALSALCLSGLFVLLTVAAFLGLPEVLIEVFLDRDEPQRPAIVVIGVGLLALAALFQLADAAQVMAMGLLRGLQDTSVPLLIALTSYWLIGLPAMYAMAFILDWGATGVWLGLVVGLVPAGLLLSARFWGKLRGLAAISPA